MLYCYHLYCNSQYRLQRNIQSRLHATNTVSDLKMFYAQCLACLLYKIHTEGLRAFFRQNFKKKYAKLRLRLQKKLKKLNKRRLTKPYYPDTQLCRISKTMDTIPVGIKTKSILPRP